jgi:WD40-like Beta Propeller Repeat
MSTPFPARGLLPLAGLMFVLAGCGGERPTDLTPAPGYGAVVPHVVVSAADARGGAYIFAVEIDGHDRIFPGLHPNDTALGGLRDDSLHTARILGVPSHCSVDASPVTFSVQDGIFTSLTFQVSCGPTPVTRVDLAFVSSLVSLESPRLLGVDAEGQGLYELAGLAGTSGMGEPVWSPDGTRLAVLAGAAAGARLYLVEPDVPRSTALTDSVAPVEASSVVGRLHWSPDGSRVAFQVRDSIRIVEVDGNGSTAFPSPPPPFYGTGGFTWSPDGTQIAISTASGIAVVALDGGVERYVSNGGSDGRPLWSPDGTRIAFDRSGVSLSDGLSARLWIAAADGSEQQATPFVAPLAWSPDGTRLLVGQFDGTLGIMQPGSDLLIIVPGTTGIWSSDGATLTLLTNVTTSGPPDVEVARVQADGTACVQVSHNGMVVDNVGGDLVLRPR